MAELVSRLEFQLAPLEVCESLLIHQTFVHVLHVALLDEASLDVYVVNCVIERTVVVAEHEIFDPGTLFKPLSLLTHVF